MKLDFQFGSLNKVLAKLEIEKINYITLDQRNNYDVDEKQDFKNQNRYLKIYERAKQKINNEKRIQNINLYLMSLSTQKDFRKILGKIEEIINESRKIQSNPND